MNSPSDKPRLKILGYGGTIMSRPTMDTASSDVVLRPQQDALKMLLGIVPASVKKDYAQITAECAELIDSSQAKANQHITRIVADVRENLTDNTAEVITVLYGTDSMAILMNALADGVAQEEIQNKTVIVTGSMRHLDHNSTDAMPNFARSLAMGISEKCRGKMGLLFGERFFSPRGLKKVRCGQKFPFMSRFHRIARFSDKTNEWIFRDPIDADTPRGTPGKAFNLTQGIEAYALTPMSDYNLLANAIKNNKATVLIAPGDGNLRTDNESINALRRAVKKAKGPIIVVPDAITDPEDEDDSEDWNDAIYCGREFSSRVRKLLSGGNMSEAEALTFLSSNIALFEQKNIPPTQYVELIGEKLALYPFRFDT